MANPLANPSLLYTVHRGSHLGCQAEVHIRFGLLHPRVPMNPRLLDFDLIRPPYLRPFHTSQSLRGGCIPLLFRATLQLPDSFRLSVHVWTEISSFNHIPVENQTSTATSYNRDLFGLWAGRWLTQPSLLLFRRR